MRGQGKQHRRHRIWLVLIGSIVIVGVAGSAGLWRWWVPQYRPALRTGEEYAIDVSHHQGEIDWSAVAEDGIGFAYLKATEGGDHTDASYATNVEEAARAGVTTGAYHFFTFCRSGREQAEHFLDVARPDDSRLPPAVDVEFGGNCAARPEPAVLRAEIADFVGLVEKAWGRPVITYVLRDTERRYAIEANLPRVRWQRHLFTRPGNDAWGLWQLSGRAHVNGIRGPTDLNDVHPSRLAARA